jgi:hypothetical protein
MHTLLSRFSKSVFVSGGTPREEGNTSCMQEADRHARFAVRSRLARELMN